jgi:hypothetical protein
MKHLLTYRALQAAIEDQKDLAQLTPQVGWDPTPYQDNLVRLRLRLIEFQKRSLDGEMYGDD